MLVRRPRPEHHQGRKSLWKHDVSNEPRSRSTRSARRAPLTLRTVQPHTQNSAHRQNVSALPSPQTSSLTRKDGTGVRGHAPRGHFLQVPEGLFFLVGTHNEGTSDNKRKEKKQLETLTSTTSRRSQLRASLAHRCERGRWGTRLDKMVY